MIARKDAMTLFAVNSVVWLFVSFEVALAPCRTRGERHPPPP